MTDERDRFAQMVLSLAGESIAQPCARRGRIFAAPRDTSDDPGLHDIECANVWHELASVTHPSIPNCGTAAQRPLARKTTP